MTQASWMAFAEARNAYLAAHDRLLDRAPVESVNPLNLTGDDLLVWVGLLQELERAASLQREAFERYSERRFQTGTARPGRDSG